MIIFEHAGGGKTLWKRGLGVFKDVQPFQELTFWNRIAEGATRCTQARLKLSLGQAIRQSENYIVRKS